MASVFDDRVHITEICHGFPPYFNDHKFIGFFNSSERQECLGDLEVEVKDPTSDKFIVRSKNSCDNRTLIIESMFNQCTGHKIELNTIIEEKGFTSYPYSVHIPDQKESMQIHYGTKHHDHRFVCFEGTLIIY